MTPSWYDILDVEPGASPAEVRAAWRDGIADLEPGSRRFQTLNQAAEVLLDEKRRAAYDAELAANDAPAVQKDRAQAQVSSPTSDAAVEQSKGASPPRTIAGDEPPPGAGRRVVPMWVIAAVAVVTLAVVAFTAFAWTRPQDRLESPSVGIIKVADRTEDATRAAQAAAEQAIVPVLSYDYKTLDADQKRATSYLTSDYRKDYDELFGVIADNAPSTKTKVTAEVIASGIIRSGQERVDVLVFVDRPTVNKLSAEPVTYKDQVTVTMQKVGDAWLIDNLKTSPAQL